ncbi:transmembrane amino acid transporter [Hyaloscypha bicolor E]|uniref:Transmembrane amino acid transporter n=1 Tax=Hyaloscypha bicolor E TaxID=1095630 RepID=A0A2J6TVC1_9HELO|nr:transmembrane amino acid transporter [Hyaloscypha bicolor E]PMD66955.1 transmembrane amino acid transporter [Hyaloscypha bicolor E]
MRTAYQLHQSVDPTILFEEYLHYAKITRREEREAEKAIEKKWSFKRMIKNRFSKGQTGTVIEVAVRQLSELDGEKNEETTVERGDPFDAFNNLTYSHPSHVSDAEWKALSRGVRTVEWSTCFYLITSDIIGPFGIPWAFSQLGYGPGVAFFTLFGSAAALAGFYLWWIFIEMDSDRYPLRDYGAAFFRVFGPKSRHIINVLQSLQMILTLGSLILGMGQSIAQISQGTSKPLCFVICLLIFVLLGIGLGQVRTLQRLGWLSNFAVWMNVLAVIICMGVIAHSPPNFEATQASFGDNFVEGPIRTFAGFPPEEYASGGKGLIAAMNGINQCVYAFAGAILFFNFLAEMRNPWDFWKGLVCAQVFLFLFYIMFGIYVYSLQGQFAFNPVQQGLSLYNYQTAANICYIMTGFIAAAMYGNIGIKVIYNNVFQELLSAPPLTVVKGKIIWVFMVPIYWAIAFIIAASIPQFSYLTGLLSAMCFVSFTYTFPALLAMGFRIKKDAMLPDESFDETTLKYTRHDDGMQRWTRGFLKHWYFNAFDALYLLASLVTVGLGSYAAIEGLISSFDGTSVATSWGCTAPV